MKTKLYLLLMSIFVGGTLVGVVLYLGSKNVDIKTTLSDVATTIQAPFSTTAESGERWVSPKEYRSFPELKKVMEEKGFDVPFFTPYINDTGGESNSFYFSYASFPELSDGKITYRIYITSMPDCGGANSCYVAEMVVDRYKMKGSNQSVTLVPGVIGYYSPMSCGGSCAPAYVEWEQNGEHYTIYFKSWFTKDELIVYARKVSENILYEVN